MGQLLPREYFDLQIRFAQTVVALDICDLATALTRYTNFHRRFGLGKTQNHVTTPEWQAYLAGARDDPMRLPGWTWQFYRQCEPEPARPAERTFGCFNFEPPDPQNVVRIHFAANDTCNNCGPLHASKRRQRSQDLTRMFAHIQRTYPEATSLKGTSWLYQTRAYTSLFPRAYIQSAQVRTINNRFDGSSNWGQLLDFRQGIKTDMATAFANNLEKLHRDALWQVFPLPALKTEAPLAVLYEHFLSQ